MNIDDAAFALFASQCEDWGLPVSAARVEWDDSEKLREFWHKQVWTVVTNIGKIWSPFSVQWMSDSELLISCVATDWCMYKETLQLGSDVSSVWADHGKRAHPYLWEDDTA